MSPSFRRATAINLSGIAADARRPAQRIDRVFNTLPKDEKARFEAQIPALQHFDTSVAEKIGAFAESLTAGCGQ